MGAEKWTIMQEASGSSTAPNAYIHNIMAPDVLATQGGGI